MSLIQILLAMLMSTIQVRWYGLENMENVHKRGIPIIYGIWHQHLLVFVFTHSYHNVKVLVSSHRDGEIIAQLLKRYGIGSIRGSSTRGGKEALFQMVSLAKKGYDLTITPDGPKGPRHQLQPGVISIAYKTGHPILLGAYSANRYWRLKSWDQFIIPKPFSKIAIVVEEPIFLDKSSSSFEENRLMVERQLQKLSEKIENFAQHPPQDIPFRRGFRYKKK